MTVDKDKDAAYKALEAYEAYKVWLAAAEAYHVSVKVSDAARKASTAAWLPVESSDVWKAYVKAANKAYEKSIPKGN